MVLAEAVGVFPPVLMLSFRRFLLVPLLPFFTVATAPFLHGNEHLYLSGNDFIQDLTEARFLGFPGHPDS
jgi:hypothetical protein